VAFMEPYDDDDAKRKRRIKRFFGSIPEVDGT
jgi:hypothetical protein